MTQLALERAVYDKLTIAPQLSGASIELQLSGVSDSFSVKPLGTYLDTVSREIDRLRLASVVVDVKQLSLLNSSSLKQFIAFLRPMKLGERRCVVEFVVDDDSPWQRRCLSALVRMCPSCVSIRGTAPPPRTASGELAYAEPSAGSERPI